MKEVIIYAYCNKTKEYKSIDFNDLLMYSNTQSGRKKLFKQICKDLEEGNIEFKGDGTIEYISKLFVKVDGYIWHVYDAICEINNMLDFVIINIGDVE